MVSNALAYNKAGTPIYKTATRIQTAAQTVLADLSNQFPHPLSAHPPPAAANGIDGMDVDEPLSPPKDSDTKSQSESPVVAPTFTSSIGDLEPPLDVLPLFVSASTIATDMKLVVTAPPLDALLAYELPKYKPPPTPPPPPKPRVTRKEMLERKKAERRREMEENAVTPRTRRGKAAAAAFEAEAGGAPPDAEVEVAEASPAEDAPGPSRPMAGRKRKRNPPQVDTRPDKPVVVDKVDSRGMFSMFEHGWILPERQRRGGRAPLERSVEPTPKKRARHCEWCALRVESWLIRIHSP